MTDWIIYSVLVSGVYTVYKINSENVLINIFLKIFLKQSKTNQITSYSQPALEGRLVAFCTRPLKTVRWMDFCTIGKSFMSSSISQIIFLQNSKKTVLPWKKRLCTAEMASLCFYLVKSDVRESYVI